MMTCLSVRKTSAVHVRSIVSKVSINPYRAQLENYQVCKLCIQRNVHLERND